MRNIKRLKKRRKEMKINDTKSFTFTSSVIVPIVVSLITVSVAGYFQLLATNKSIEGQIEAAIKSSDAQIEAAIKASEAQIKAAEISKVTEIEYDYKETNNWNVSESKDYMPLNKSNYWIYNGSYTGYSIKLNKDVTKEIEIKFEIIDEIENNGVKLFKISNFPQEMTSIIRQQFDELTEEQLNSSQQIKYVGRENLSGLLLVANKLFFIPNEQLESVEKFIMEPDKIINKEFVNKPPTLSYENLIFEFPLFKGQRFGDLNTITRSDFSHFWYVNDVRRIDSLIGDTYKEIQIYELIYNTLPDQQRLVFRPYLGIISYEYTHKGTSDNFHFTLSEFKLDTIN